MIRRFVFLHVRPRFAVLSYNRLSLHISTSRAAVPPCRRFVSLTFSVAAFYAKNHRMR